MPSHQPPPSLRTWDPVLSPAGAPRREGSAQQLSWALNGRWVGTQLGSCCRRGCVRTANVWGRGACGHQPPASATPPPTFAFGKTLTDCAPIARPLQARVSHGLDGDRAVRRGGRLESTFRALARQRGVLVQSSRASDTATVLESRPRPLSVHIAPPSIPAGANCRRPDLMPRTLANTPLPARTRPRVLARHPTLDPAPRPRAARALEHVRCFTC